MRLSQRIADLESRMPEGKPGWVRVFQHTGQSQDEAITAYEAANGPIGDSNVILRVFTSPVGSPVRR